MNRTGWCFALLTCMISFDAAAQAELSAEDPRIFSIQERPHRLGHEFSLGLGVIPLDAFYVGAVLNASYTYHFSDFWAWEIASIGYSVNFDTSLESNLLRDFGVRPVRGGGDRVQVFGATSLVVKPLFGKVAVFNQRVWYAETFAVLGVGPLLQRPRAGTGGGEDEFTVAANLGIGMRFWTNGSLSWRVDLRDYMVFDELPPENILFIAFSASFNYATNDEEDEL